MIRRFVAIALLVCFAGASRAADSVDLHELPWYVHVDMITAQTPLSFYEALIDDWVADASERLKGDQGPFDTPCCTELSKISIGTFGTPGDGLDMPDSEEDIDAFYDIGGTGSRAFLVDTLAYCSGPGSPIGCGVIPGCTGDPDDDPSLWFIVSMEAHEIFDVAANTAAHERGHNTCLNHVSANSCQIMRSSSGGGCLTSSECDNYRDGRTGAGGSCDCHASAGSPEPDGTSCSEGAVTGVCSGGLCGDSGSDAGVQLLAAGGPESIGGATPDDPLLTSGLTGGWTDLGAFGTGVEVTGLAYASDRAVLYGVAPTAGDDELITIDPSTGSKIATVGALSSITGVVGLAFDPGPTASETDDRLLALKDRPSTTEQLLSIDPDDASVSVLGNLNLGGGFDGLAYDSVNQALYASSPFAGGLYEIDPSCPGLCPVSQVGGVDRVRFDSALAYSPATEQLYLIGRQAGPRLLYDTIDANSLASPATVGIDGYTPGGLAAIPLPEPAGGISLVAGLVMLRGLGRRRGARAGTARPTRI